MLSSTSKQPLFNFPAIGLSVMSTVRSCPVRVVSGCPSHHGVVLGYSLMQQWVPFIGLIE